MPGRVRVTDEVFEQRLRRDLRRLADHLAQRPEATDADRRPSDAATGPGARKRVGRSRPGWPLTRRAGWPLSRRAGGAVVALWLAVGACLIASGVVAGQALAGHTVAGPLPRGTAAALSASAGPSAYVSAGVLYSAEPGAAPRAVAHVGSSASAPQWSPDDRWLAYEGADGQAHVVRPSGAAAHLALGGQVAALAWSPAADLLAVIGAAPGDQGQLLLVPVQAGAAATPTVLASDVSSFVWSADGHRIAYSQARRGTASNRLAVVDVVTGAVTVLPYLPPPGDGVELAGWWPDGAGVLLWLDPGRSLAAEATGLELYSLPLRGTAPMALARTFVYLPWLAWSPGGHRLAVVTMAGDFTWRGTSLAVCHPVAGTCATLRQPAGTMSLDPAWSPGGRRLAFVRAPVLGAGSPGQGLDAWYGHRELWISAADGRGAHQVRGAPGGAAAPQFDAGGTAVTVVTGSSVVDVPLDGARATTLLSGLVGALDTAGPDGYGKLPWGGTVAWGAS